VPLATLGWRWVFWASVPFSLAAVVIGWLVIPQTADRGFDWRRAMRPPLACNSSSCVNPAVTSPLVWSRDDST
jgi:predicted MFS family arabinose efflux permease